MSLRISVAAGYADRMRADPYDGRIAQMTDVVVADIAAQCNIRPANRVNNRVCRRDSLLFGEAGALISDARTRFTNIFPWKQNYLYKK